uniref:ANK_REP_REGION domain-containing protein n=1 Tax=Glossina pallidipes TaxID=7398 RepID=A0A1A9ZX84_GLOPL
MSLQHNHMECTLTGVPLLKDQPNSAASTAEEVCNQMFLSRGPTNKKKSSTAMLLEKTYFLAFDARMMTKNYSQLQAKACPNSVKRLELQKTDNFGSTPFHLACLSGKMTCVRLSCGKSNFDLEPRDKDGKTPIMLAQTHQHHDIVRALCYEVKKKSRWLHSVSEIWGWLFGGASDSKEAFPPYPGNIERDYQALDKAKTS